MSWRTCVVVKQIQSNPIILPPHCDDPLLEANVGWFLVPCQAQVLNELDLRTDKERFFFQAEDHEVEIHVFWQSGIQPAVPALAVVVCPDCPVVYAPRLHRPDARLEPGGPHVLEQVRQTAVSVLESSVLQSVEGAVDGVMGQVVEGQQFPQEGSKWPFRIPVRRRQPILFELPLHGLRPMESTMEYMAPPGPHFLKQHHN